MGAQGNGRNDAPLTAAGTRVFTLTLTKDFDTHALNIGGEMPTLEEGINMLQQAIRTLEDQRRIAALQAAMNKPMVPSGKQILDFGKH